MRDLFLAISSDLHVTFLDDFYQPMIFQGEEMSIGIRGWTIGYDYYAFERVSFFLWHMELSETGGNLKPGLKSRCSLL